MGKRDGDQPLNGEERAEAIAQALADVRIEMFGVLGPERFAEHEVASEPAEARLIHGGPALSFPSGDLYGPLYVKDEHGLPVGGVLVMRDRGPLREVSLYRAGQLVSREFSVLGSPELN